MRYILMLITFFMSLVLQAQQCSRPNFTLVSEQSTNKISCPDPAGGQLAGVPVSITDNYSINCTYTSGSAQAGAGPYFSDTSTVTGNGQCGPVSGLRCNPIMNMHTTTATDASGSGGAGNNQFFNDATDQTINTSGAGQPCIRGFAREDFHQCAGQPCAPPTPTPTPPPPAPTPTPCASPDGTPDLRFGHTDGESSNPCASPIIIDTSGSGYHLTSVANGVMFDIAGTGTPMRLGWTQPGSGNAFLVLPGANGTVSTGQQLFGNFTPQPPSATPNGYAALAVYDQPDHGGNGDGVIDQNDQIFSSLRLWLDENHDGVCQPEELYTLPQLGVFSISLDYSLSERTDDYGNLFRYKARINQGTHKEDDPVGRKAYDIFFVAQ